VIVSRWMGNKLRAIVPVSKSPVCTKPYLPLGKAHTESYALYRAYDLFVQSKIQFISTTPWYWSVNHSDRSTGLAAQQPVFIAFPAHPLPLRWPILRYGSSAVIQQAHRSVSRTVGQFSNSSDNRAPRCSMPACLSALRFPSFLSTEQTKPSSHPPYNNALLLQLMISDLAVLFPSISPPPLCPSKKKENRKKKQSGKPTVSHGKPF